MVSWFFRALVHDSLSRKTSQKISSCLVLLILPSPPLPSRNTRRPTYSPGPVWQGQAVQQQLQISGWWCLDLILSPMVLGSGLCPVPSGRLQVTGLLFVNPPSPTPGPIPSLVVLIQTVEQNFLHFPALNSHCSLGPPELREVWLGHKDQGDWLLFHLPVPAWEHSLNLIVFTFS